MTSGCGALVVIWIIGFVVARVGPELEIGIWRYGLVPVIIACGCFDAIGMAVITGSVLSALRHKDRGS